jgi:transcriptional regulator with XRE-family HTH domain
MPSRIGHPRPHTSSDVRGISSDVLRLTTTRTAFARRLRLAREAQQLSQAAMAELVGCEARTLRRIEHGRCWPRLDTCLRLAEALHVPVDTLLARPEPVHNVTLQLDVVAGLLRAVPTEAARSLARLFALVASRRGLTRRDVDQRGGRAPQSRQ